MSTVYNLTKTILYSFCDLCDYLLVVNSAYNSLIRQVQFLFSGRKNFTVDHVKEK